MVEREASAIPRPCIWRSWYWAFVETVFPSGSWYLMSIFKKGFEKNGSIDGSARTGRVFVLCVVVKD